MKTKYIVGTLLLLTVVIPLSCLPFVSNNSQKQYITTNTNYDEETSSIKQTSLYDEEETPPDQEYNDSQGVKKYYFDLSEPEQFAESTVVWEIFVPQNIAKATDQSWELNFKNGSLKFKTGYACDGGRPDTSGTNPVDGEIHHIYSNENTESNNELWKTSNDYSEPNYEKIEDSGGDGGQWCSDDEIYGNLSFKIEQSGSQFYLLMKATLQNKKDVDSEFITAVEHLYTMPMEFYDQYDNSFGEENVIIFEGNIYYKNTNLSATRFYESETLLNDIEQNFEEFWGTFVPIGTTYSEIESIIFDSISKEYFLNELSVDILFLDENGQVVIDENVPITNPTLTIQIKGLDDSDAGINGESGKFYGITEPFNITIPYINFQLKPINTTNLYGQNSTSGIYNDQDSWEWIDELEISTPSGFETINNLIFRTNTDMLFSYNDPYVEKAVVENPDGTSTVVMPGESYLIEYDYEQWSSQDYTNTITFYLKDGNTVDFIYNVKQKSSPIDVISDNHKQTSEVYILEEEENTKIVDAYTLNEFPQLTFDSQLIKEVYVTTPLQTYELEINNDVMKNDGYGLYKIEAYDYFGNVNTQYIEMYEEQPTIFVQKFEETNEGKTLYSDALSLGISYNEMKSYKVQDLYKLTNDLSNKYQLSTFDLNEKEIEEYFNDQDNSDLLLSDVETEINEYIFRKLNDEIYKPEQYDSSEYIEIQYYDQEKNLLKSTDSLPKNIYIVITPKDDLYHDMEGIHNSYNTTVIGYFVSDLINVYDFDSINLDEIIIDASYISKSIGHYDISGKTFGDIETTINEAIVDQVNLSTVAVSNNVSFNTNDFNYKWTAKTKENDYQKVELESEDQLNILLSNTLTFEITPNNDKTVGYISGNVEFDFYESTDISNSTITNINNDLVPIYIGTEFWQVKEWLDNEILYLLNDELFHYETFKEEITMNDILIQYSIESDYQFLNECESFTYTVTGISEKWYGSFTGTATFNIEMKIDNISTYSFSNEAMVARNSDVINNINSNTTLIEIQPKLEEEIANQLEIENPKNKNNFMTLSTHNIDIEDQSKISANDLIFEYSISTDESVWNSFEISVYYKYKPEQDPLNITIDLVTNSNMAAYWLITSLIIIIGIMLLCWILYFGLRKNPNNWKKGIYEKQK